MSVLIVIRSLYLLLIFTLQRYYRNGLIYSHFEVFIFKFIVE